MNHHQQQQQEQASFGLTRYKSAPSSYFATIFSGDDGFEGDDFNNLFNPRASIPQTVEIFPRFMDSVTNQQLQRHESNDFSSVSHMMYRSQPQQAYNSEAATSSSLNVDRGDQMKINGGINNLIRHSSSPAGFFVDFENEIDAMRGVGNFGAGISTNGEASMLSFKNPMNFSSNHPSSSSKTMKPIDEMGCKTSRWLEEDGNKNGGYISNFPAMTSSDLQNTDNQNRRPIPLSHHLSLPKDSALLYEMLSPDAVPCRTRAKRGFATHPRSIAERVRRTKISERMRKLQELVPNMDNQTSTSDMLDLAVDYIKDLQVQVERLSNTQAKCTCSTGERTEIESPQR